MDQSAPWYEYSDLSSSPAPDGGTGRSPKRWRRLAVAGVGSLAVAGGITGVALTSGAAATTDPTTSTTTVPKGASGASKSDRAAKRTERLKEILQPLVDAGTITEAQRDAVVGRLADVAGSMGRGHRGDRAGHLGGGALLDTAAKALGISADDLRTALREGKSIAEVATSKGVDVNKVIDALVAERTEALSSRQLPEGVTKPTEAQIRERVTALVNGEVPMGRRGHRGDHRGPGSSSGGADTTTTTVN